MLEENVRKWTRGKLTGEWQLSDSDIAALLHLNVRYTVHVTQALEAMYSGNDSMQIIMTSNAALTYNRDYRERQVFKMRTLPWDTNLLNAYHNLHFILFMADTTPNFEPFETGFGPVKSMEIPGQDLWIMQLLMKAATDCIRDDFVRLSKNHDSYDYRIDVNMTVDGEATLMLHVSTEYTFEIYAKFEPTVNKNGTFGCKYRVGLSCVNWNYDQLPLTGPKSVKDPMKKNMLAMRDYLRKELKRFSRMLATAEFNRPEYALRVINGK